MKEIISDLLRKQNMEFEAGANYFFNLYCFANI